MTSNNKQGRDKNIALAIVVIYIAAVSLLIVYDHDLWNPNEHRVAAIVKEMADSGNLVVPTLNGQPFLQKPPLYHVTAVLIFKLFKGEAARTFRITSAFYGIFNYSTVHLTIIFIAGIITASMSILAALIYLIARIGDFTIFGSSPGDVPGFTTLILVIFFSAESS